MKKHLVTNFNKMAKTTLAVVMAGAFTLPTSKVFAESTESSSIQTIGTDSVQTETTLLTSEKQSEQLADNSKPSLVPGDFFYFAKIAVERIKLVLTTNDAKEAQLLAEYASERLAEAEALMAQGEEERALKTIEAAMENLNNVNQTVTTNLEEMKESQPDSAVEGGTREKQVEEVKTANNEQKPVEESKTEIEKDPYQNIDLLLSQNIIALTHAMEKVDNPVAKAALKKNIEKSYQKLAKKIEKIEVEDGRLEETQKITEDSTQTGTTTSPEQAVAATDEAKEAKADEKDDDKTTETTSIKTTDLKGSTKKGKEKKSKKQSVSQKKLTAKETKQQKKREKEIKKQTKANVKAAGNKGTKGKGKQKK